MTTQIDALTAALTAHGMSAKAWKGQRIYLNGYGRDISAYIMLDDPDATAWDYAYQGGALKVFTNAEQDRKWQINRCKQVKHEIMHAIWNAGVCGTLPAHCENWQDVGL